MRKIRTKATKPSTRPGRTTWIGGVINVPDPRGSDGDDGPVVALVLTLDGFVRASALQPPGFAGEAIATAVAQSLTRPRVGAPDAPDILIVSTAELAAAFASHLPATQIVIRPTPEIDEVATAMRQRMLGGDKPVRRPQQP